MTLLGAQMSDWAILRDVLFLDLPQPRTLRIQIALDGFELVGSGSNSTSGIRQVAPLRFGCDPSLKWHTGAEGLPAGAAQLCSTARVSLVSELRCQSCCQLCIRGRFTMLDLSDDNECPPGARVGLEIESRGVVL